MTQNPPETELPAQVRLSAQASPTDEQRAVSERLGISGQCPQCHLGGYNGVSRNPRLAGQTPEYLEKTMLDFKSKDRHNSPSKSSLMKSYSEDDITAMAAFAAAK